MRSIRHIGCIALIVLLMLTATPDSTSFAQANQRMQVLVLHSYHRGYQWTDDIMEGIEAVLGAEAQNVELYVEYMDTKRIFDKEYMRRLYEVYKHKFSDQQFDVIISSDNNAFDFLLQHRDDLFPATPVVFCGVNFFEESILEGHDLFTGVNEEVDLRGTLDIALKLHPNTKQVVIVNDTTTTGLKVHERIMEIIPEYEDSVDFTLLEDVDMADVQETVQNLPPDSLVFYTLFLRDGSGQFFEYDESISLIAENSPVPVYGTWDFSLGHGIVGGLLTSGYSQGETAAQLASQILEGESVENVPVVKQSPNRYMFDHQQMQRFNIPEVALPVGSVIINQPVSFYDTYRNWIWGAGITLVGFFAIVAVLSASNLRRRRAEEALRASHRELQAARESLEQRVNERARELERRSTYMEASVEVGRVASSILDADLLIQEVVDLICQSFDFYYVGLFLIDETGEWAVLQAGTGKAGETVLARGHRLRVGQGMIGWSIANAQARIALHPEEDAVRLTTAELPDTHSEVALPLRTRGQVIGALTVQSDQEHAFDENSITILQSMADQVAVALDNARLFTENQAALEAARRAYDELSREAWIKLIRTQPNLGYRSSASGTLSTVDTWKSNMELALRVGETIQGNGTSPDQDIQEDQANRVLTVPIKVREDADPIGVLETHKPIEAGEWTEEEVNLLEAIADQLGIALEGARLYQDAQRRAARERLTREITDKMRRATDVEDIVQTAVDELFNILGTSHAFVRLRSAPSESEDDDQADLDQ